MIPITFKLLSMQVVTDEFEVRRFKKNSLD